MNCKLNQLILLALAQPIFAQTAFAEPSFVDRADALPAPHVYAGGWEHFVGGGVAILDCNADHRPDLFAAGGTDPAHLFVNTSDPGAIGFTAGRLPDLRGVTGAWPLDIDSDGWLDLMVLRQGANLILKGGPECSFTDASADFGFDGGDRWSTAFTATWETGARLPVLVIGNYVDQKNPNGPFEACDVNELHRPEGDRYGSPHLIEPGFCALSALISDWQRSGQRTLRLSNDRQYYVRKGYEQMFTLPDLREYTEADGWPKMKLWGMGIASRDITGDGLPEVMLTSMGDQHLMMNTGTGFTPAPFGIGTYAATPHIGDDGRPATGWHAEFGDIDNDGRADLFMAKGNVQQMMSNAIHDPNNLLMQQADGTFIETAAKAGIATMEKSRGAGLADLDGDGRLDIVVINREKPMEIWENTTGATGHWLAVTPRQQGVNGFAVGAWVEARSAGRTQAIEITVGGGHGSGKAGPLHFGLGPTDSAEVRVIWPDGVASDWLALRADRKVTLWREGSALRAE